MRRTNLPWYKPAKHELRVLRIRADADGAHVAVDIDGRREGLHVDISRVRNLGSFLEYVESTYGPGVRVRPWPRDWPRFVDKLIAKSET